MRNRVNQQHDHKRYQAPKTMPAHRDPDPPFSFTTSEYRYDATDCVSERRKHTTTADIGGVRYYGYRYYNPGLGRWVSRDPVWEKSGINLYVFVHNSSIKFIDPDGREAKSSDGSDAGSILEDQSPSYNSCVKWRYIFSYVRKHWLISSNSTTVDKEQRSFPCKIAAYGEKKLNFLGFKYRCPWQLLSVSIQVLPKGGFKYNPADPCSVYTKDREMRYWASVGVAEAGSSARDKVFWKEPNLLGKPTPAFPYGGPFPFKVWYEYSFGINRFTPSYPKDYVISRGVRALLPKDNGWDDLPELRFSVEDRTISL